MREHRRVLTALDAESIEIKKVEHLELVDGLVLPGGESTTIGKLMAATGLLGAIKNAGARGLPVFGTCAGLILMARAAGDGAENLLGLMDISVSRNAYGRQNESFEAQLEVDLGGRRLMNGVFIRAPIINEVGSSVRVLAKYRDHPVMVTEGPFLGCAFHPELTDDTGVHRYFLEMVRAAGSSGNGR